MKRILLMFIAIFQIAFLANAQQTTSGITGLITNDKGETLPGATILAVHEESGSQYGAITNNSGRYFLQGLRAGGPYKIEVSFVGYKKERLENITLQLGVIGTFDFTLVADDNNIEEVVVVSDAPLHNSGTTSNFKQSDIENTPSVNRSIYDIAQYNPLANISKQGGITFAGSNNRYNSFQIDGTVSNDVFGLASSGTNGGQTESKPVSLEAIQEIQVVVSPFDVTQSGFTGGGINAVTKSGTNKFTGSAYAYYTDESFYGKWNQELDQEIKLEDEKTRTLGAHLGGAIIKNKLFFFVSAENTYNEYPVNYYPGYTDGYVSVNEAQAIQDHFYQVTGISESYGKKNLDRNSWNFLGRLDWNINNKHKLALRYQYNDSYKNVYGAGSKSYFFANSGYKMKNKTNSVVLEANSRFNDNLYNEFRAGMTFVRDSREVDYTSPCIQISSTGGENFDVTNNIASTGSITTNIGTEYSSGANSLDVDVYTVEDNLSIYKDNHTFTVGTHNEFYKMKNLFIQAVNGAYYYNSTEDFLNDTAYKFVYNYSDPDITGTNRWTGSPQAGQYGFYAQDKWNVTRNINLTYGLRIDIPVTFNSPSTNEEFNNSEYATKYDVKVGNTPKTNILWSPRFGFNIYTDNSHNTLIRGGMGMFTGRVPFVWLSNLWNNTGVEMKGTTITKNVPSFETFGTDASAAANSTAGSASKPTINTCDEDFKYPQVLRANLAVEQRLPGDVKLTVEGLWSKTLNNVFFRNLALTQSGYRNAITGNIDETEISAADAPFYTSNSGKYYSIINLENTNKGYTGSLSLRLEKNFKFGLNLMAAYTYSRSKSVNDGTSSVAYSNWKYNYSINTNEPELSYSIFDNPHRIIGTVSYTTPVYGKIFSTTIGLTYTGTSGQRYCLTMNEDVDFNGDSQKGNSMLYIPTAEELSQMNFVSEEDRTEFENWINNDDYASEHRGQYAKRYSNLASFENHFNLHIAENITYLKERGSKIQITFDITNLGNLLNHDWGTYYESTYNLQVLKYSSIKENGKIVGYNYSFNDGELSISDFYSRWHAQIGIKVTF